MEASGHQLLIKKLVWNMFFPHMLSEWFMGVVCVGLWSSRATLESEKPCNFMVESSFFKVSIKKMRGGSGKSLRSFFFDLGVGLRSLGVILDVLHRC